jgi:hypothetical protein
MCIDCIALPICCTVCHRPTTLPRH